MDGIILVPRSPKKGPVRSIDTQKKKRSIYRVLATVFTVCFFGILGLVVYIKYDTAAAANLTDNVLRPILGADRVLFLEKIFFNTSDRLERLTFRQDTTTTPEFSDNNLGENLAASNLDLTPIPVNQDFTPISEEGVWKNRQLTVFPDKEVIAYSFVRSDPNRPFSITTVAQIDTKAIAVGLVAGIKEPGGPVGKPGPGIVPKDIIESGNLIAAFDGGFQYRDGAYGMIVGDTTYLPLKNDLGTFIGYKDGTLKIVDYQGEPLGPDVAFVRQNCPILINNGEITVDNPRSKVLWGRLAKGTTDIYTWRSGIGLNKNGDLLFAVGNNLTPTTLANALQAAGAITAIQLDINPIWVRFNIFDSIGSGRYTSVPLNKQLYDGENGYLKGYNKDFFYLYKK